MDEVQNAETTVQAETVEKTTAEKLVTGNSKKRGFPKELVLSLVIIAAIIVAIVALTKRTTIDLNKYATVRVEGYNTVGVATMVFDYDKFTQDYGQKIKFKNENKEEMPIKQLLYGSAASAMLDLNVSGSFDKSSGLSNGDTIVYTWDVDEKSIKEEYGVNVKFKDIKFKVKDLEEIPTFDPFAGVEVIFSGIGPNGTAELKNNSSSEIASLLRLKVDKTSGLSNGDVVTVTLQDDGSQTPTQYFIKRYNAIPTVTEKKFTVEGLGSYVKSASEIPEDAMTKMQSQAQDVINAYVANNWSEIAKLDKLTYIGNYFLYGKSNMYNGQNKIFLVYRASASLKSEEYGIDDAFDYYIGVQYSNLILLADGTCSLDISSARMLNASFQKTYPGGFFGRTYTFQGYGDLDTMFNKNVTVNIANYQYENNVVDK